ncbi:hypothetical protein DUI87_00104 [Hirundo rustica rustica]|uniref:Protein kinase domain-containing protein n=1 Tax=Hirundo rustica rustica TaxID=333673 RepID=A0A3M0LBB2_HIRRU|nr:hypothetical protein DUI87_00104 [Hirundo rustica rustica]
MFPAAQILHVALSVARALQYLHTEQRLLHGDVKSPNVVVRGDFQDVKICDVGVSLPLDHNMQGGDSAGDSQNSRQIPKIPGKFPTVSDPDLCYVGTEPWSPPEALEPGGIISDRSDIFPFGLTLWEMLALSVPHLPGAAEDSDSEDPGSEDSFDEDSYLAALGSRPPLPPEALDPSQDSVRELIPRASGTRDGTGDPNDNDPNDPNCNPNDPDPNDPNPDDPNDPDPNDPNPNDPDPNDPNPDDPDPDDPDPNDPDPDPNNPNPDDPNDQIPMIPIPIIQIPMIPMIKSQ